MEYLKRRPAPHSHTMSPRVRLSAWTRTGCDTCKRRHKKCDGQKPRCLACTRLNLDCVQPDVFCAVPPSKPALRSKRATPQAVPRKPSPLVDTARSHDPIRLNDTTRQEEEECLILSRLSFTYCPKQFHFDITQPECWLFQYYVERLSGLLVNAIGHENPLQSLIVPRVLSSPLLLRTVCAISALHRSSYADGSEVTQYQTEATGHYVRALSDLREQVPLLHGKDNAELLQNVLLSSIFLCKYEIIKDGVTNWRRHLKGIESFCHLLGRDKSRTAMPDIMDFTRSFITYHKGIASLTEQGMSVTPPDENTGGTSHDAFPETSRQGAELQAVDPYMGFSRGLIVILRRVMGLLNLDPDSGCTLSWVELELQSLLTLLSRRNWTAEHFVRPKGMTDETVARLEHVSRAYENAVHACLHSVVEELSTRGCMTEEAWEELRHMLPVSKETALMACNADIDLVPCGSPEEAGLLPVLFIVACETENPEQMMTILQRVTILEAHVGLGNIRYAAALLREVWSRRKQLRRRHDWRGVLALTNWDLIIT